MQIHDNHKRRIETTFSMLDEFLCSLQRWADGKAITSLLFQENNNLAPEQRQQLQNEIIALEKLVKEVKDDLDLTTRTLDVGRVLQGSGAIFTAYIDELDAQRLSDYGPPSPELIAYLEPKLKELDKNLDVISKIGAAALKKPKK